MFATWLTSAEFHYARGWPPHDIASSMNELHKAYALYPYMPRFRDGAAIRLKIFVLFDQ